MLKQTLKYIFNIFRLRNQVLFYKSSIVSIESQFEGKNKIGKHSQFHGEIGYCSYICDYSYIIGKIGKFTSIGSYVRINPGSHPYTYPYVSTSPYFISTRKQNGYSLTKHNRFEEIRYADSINKHSVIIGNDCWIGDGVFITGGVTIGDGAVILAHAVVTKDIPPFAIVGGVPAKILKFRYDHETIQFLLDFKWWNKDNKWLKENIELMCDIELLKNKFK